MASLTIGRRVGGVSHNFARTFLRTKTSSCTAEWRGPLDVGAGALTAKSGAFSGMAYDKPSRFGDDATKTNPEELIGAAHAGCFSMFLSALLSKQDLKPDLVKTTADVTIEVGDSGPAITSIALKSEAKCPGISAEELGKLAQQAKDACPITKALTGVPKVTLDFTAL